MVMLKASSYCPITRLTVAEPSSSRISGSLNCTPHAPCEIRHRTPVATGEGGREGGRGEGEKEEMAAVTLGAHLIEELAPDWLRLRRTQFVLPDSCQAA